jgi:hypothetical protein
MITEQSTAKPERAMSEDKRRSYAVDDVQTIARRMKEIAAEREAAVAANPMPDSIEFWQPLIDAGILTVGEA